MKKYKFEEFTQKIKDRIFQEWLDTESSYFEIDNDYYIEHLAEYGFNNATIYWSGFNSQGDGACFEIESFDFNKYFEKTEYKISDNEKDIVNENMVGIIISHGRYNHEHSKQFDIESYCNDEYHNKILVEIKEAIEKTRLDLSKEIYKSIENEYNYNISIERFLEYIKDNNIQYTIFGDVYKDDSHYSFLELSNLQCNYFINGINSFIHFDITKFKNEEMKKHYEGILPIIHKYICNEWVFEKVENFTNKKGELNYKDYFNNAMQLKKDKNTFETFIINQCNDILKKGIIEEKKVGKL